MADPQAPFHLDPELTAVANLVTNETLIADEVLPRVPVNQETFRYLEIPRGENFTVPETLVGREGDPNEVHFTGQSRDGSVEGHALLAPVPVQDRAQAASNYDPRARAAEGTTGLLQLRRELNMAQTVFDANNYAANNKETLVGANQWSHTSSDPVRKILETMDTMVMRPNIMVVGQEVATQLILHPSIVKAFHRTEGDKGKVSLDFLAGLLGIERVLVGKAWQNNQNLGQDPSFVRVWGKSAALLHRSSLAIPTAGGIQVLSWGATFVWPIEGRDLATFTWTDPKPGTQGVEWIKVSQRYTHKLIANDFGFLFVNAVA